MEISTGYRPSMCAEWSLPSRPPLPTWGKAVASLPSAATLPCEPASRARASYSMTKGAIASLVRGVAIDLAPRGITVNNVQPGPTVTDMTSVPGTGGGGKAADPARAHGQHGEDCRHGGDPGRAGYGFVTGASMTIDGGYVA